MCGKSVVPNSRTYLELAQKYGIIAHKIDPQFVDTVVTPRDKIHVIFDWRGEMILAPVTWGFRADGTLYNARSDAVDKPTWRDCFTYNRCIFPIAAFVEGKTQFRAVTDDPLYVAGLYGVRPGPTGDQIFCATLLTTGANTVVAPHHARMPVLCPPEGVPAWVGIATNGKAAPLLGAFTEYSKEVALLAA